MTNEHINLIYLNDITLKYDHPMSCGVTKERQNDF